MKPGTEQNPYEVYITFHPPEGRAIRLSFSAVGWDGEQFNTSHDFFLAAEVMRHDLAAEMHMLLGVQVAFNDVESSVAVNPVGHSTMFHAAVLNLSGGREVTSEVVVSVLIEVLKGRAGVWRVQVSNTLE